MIFSLSKDNAPKFPDVKLEGRRVMLRPPSSADAQAWIDVRGKHKEFLTPLEPRWPQDALTRDFYMRRLARQANDWQAGRGHSFLIFAENTLAGGVNINNVCRGAAQFASLGYWLAEDAQGKGFMREALTLVINYGFKELELHRFNAACLLHNERSIKLLRNLGFAEEGQAKKYLQIAGEYQDHVLFGLNKEDWK